MEKYSEKNFVFETIIDEARGSWQNSWGNPEFGMYNINYSSILTFLIQCAGRICSRYASDLFVTWHKIYACLNDYSYDGGTYLFGFREMGVDSNTFLLSRLNQYGKEATEKEVKEIYMLKVNITKFNGLYKEADIDMQFGKAVIKEEDDA